MTWLRKRSLRFKISFAIIVGLTAIFSIVRYGVSQYLQSNLWNYQVNSALDLNTSIALQLEELMVANEWDKVPLMLKKMSNKSWRTEINDIALFNDQYKLVAFEGEFLMDNPVQQTDVEVSDLKDPACWVCHEIPPEERPTMVLLNINGQEVMRNSVPLYNKAECNVCHGTENLVLGDSIIDINLSSYRKTSSLVLAGITGGGILAIIAIAVLLSFSINKIMLQPIGDLLKAIQTVLRGDYNPTIRVRSEDEIGKLSLAFISLTDQLRSFIGNLEQKVVDRTNTLEQRSIQLRSAVSIGGQAIAMRNLDDLTEKITQIISNEYEFQIVNLFLIDDQNENLVLVGSNNEIGTNLISSGLRVNLKEKGFLQMVIANGEAAAFPSDKEGSSIHNLFEYFKSPYGFAVPLKIGKNNIGLLDIQGITISSFSEDDLVSIQLLANQIAVAVDNARLLSENKDNLMQLESVIGAATYDAWSKRISQRVNSFKYSSTGTVKETQPKSKEIALEESSKTNTIETQISLKGQKIGIITVNRAKDNPWQESEQLLMDDIASQVALALENARILEAAQRKAAQELVISELSATPETDSILRNAAEILGKLLGNSKVTVKLQSNDEGSDSFEKSEDK